MGSLWIDHGDVRVTVEWKGGALELGRFNRILQAATQTWCSTAGIHENHLPASALTYQADDAEPEP